MKMATPSLPAEYVVPKVWEPPETDGGRLGGMNRSTSGPRELKILPVGIHPLQLYSHGTPNGIKCTILLEEIHDVIGIEYDAWKVDIFQLDQFGSDFVTLNPNSKIPAMQDMNFSPPLRVFESGNILKHVAEKYDMFIPKEPRSQTECFNWLFWQMAGAGFMGGGFSHFYSYAPVKIEYAINRYAMETKRQLHVLDVHLANKTWICGDEYSIADMAVWPWIRSCKNNANDFLSIGQYSHLNRWYEHMSCRPAVIRGVRVNGFGDSAIKERHSKTDFEG